MGDLDSFEFKKVLKEAGMNQKDFGEKLGMSHSGVRNGVYRGTRKGVSVWLKSFLLGYKLGKDAEKNRHDG